MTQFNLLSENNRLFFEAELLKKLNDNKESFDQQTKQPRAIAEAVEEYVKKSFVSCWPAGMIKRDATSSLSRRAMADILVYDNDDIEYSVDIKTTCLTANFHMPNISSIKRLSDYYFNSNNVCFIILVIRYKMNSDGISFDGIEMGAIEQVVWDGQLQIENLGWGQLQITSAKEKLIFDRTATRKDFLLMLTEEAEKYYDKLIRKTEERKNFFKNRLTEYK